jgi:pSer/pThr/pTyr-binding forkhead associated (FHA) protein
VEDDQPLLELYEPESERRIRIEAPTVFGRASEVYAYAGEEGRTFSAAVLAELTRLDFVKIDEHLISRTHGLLNPKREGPVIQDLNSHNGVFLNGVQIPATNTEGVGPEVPLQDGDLIKIGGLAFLVERARKDRQALLEELSSQRRALAAPLADSQLTGVIELLRGSRRFSTSLAATWEEVEAGLARVGVETLSNRTGIFLFALHVKVKGPTLELAGEERAASDLIGRLNSIHGSKILAIQADGDPGALEAIFADQAHHDALLLTTTLPDAAILAESVEEDLCSIPLDRAAAGRASKRQLAAYHGLFDGIEALVPVDSNLLDLAWYQGYEGALRLTSGARRPHDDEEIATSYVLRDDGSAPMSNRTYNF